VSACPIAVRLSLRRRRVTGVDRAAQDAWWEAGHRGARADTQVTGHNGEAGTGDRRTCEDREGARRRQVHRQLRRARCRSSEHDDDDSKDDPQYRWRRGTEGTANMATAVGAHSMHREAICDGESP
jgi:hypothetical protein